MTYAAASCQRWAVLHCAPELLFERRGHQHMEAHPSVQDVAHTLGAIPHERHQASPAQSQGHDHLLTK